MKLTNNLLNRPVRINLFLKARKLKTLISIPHFSLMKNLLCSTKDRSSVHHGCFTHTYSCLKKSKLGLKCTTYFKHVQEAQKLSRNGRVPIADGVRSYGRSQLERIIDNCHSDAHKAIGGSEIIAHEAGENLDKMLEKW